MIAHFFFFACAGLLNTCVDWGVYFALSHIIHLSLPLAKGLGVCAGVTSAYFINTLVVFRTNNTHSSSISIKKFGKFVSCYSIGMILNVLVFHVSIQVGVKEIISLLIATGVSLITNYTLLKVVMFKSSTTANCDIESGGVNT